MGIFDKIKKALGIESANSSPKPTEAAKGKGGIQESQKIVDEFDEILNQALAQAKGSKAYIYDAKATEWDVYQNLVKKIRLRPPGTASQRIASNLYQTTLKDQTDDGR